MFDYGKLGRKRPAPDFLGWEGRSKGIVGVSGYLIVFLDLHIHSSTAYTSDRDLGARGRKKRESSSGEKSR